MSSIPHSLIASNHGWQAGFLSVLPAIQTHAQIQFRDFSPERREDAIQEAIASACVSYSLLDAQGKLSVAHPGTLARFAVKHVRNARHVGGSQESAKDVMSPIAQVRHGFTTGRFDDPSNRWRQSIIQSRNTSIPDLAAFRIDFAVWLKTLPRRDRRIVLALIKGESVSDLARRLHISPARVSQLRRDYERRWQVFQGDMTVMKIAA